jgi:hypothetical protein
VAGSIQHRPQGAHTEPSPGASLTGLLVLAEVNSSQAVLATLTYRLASYWAPLCAGPIAYGLFRIRYRSHPSPRRPPWVPQWDGRVN